MTEDNLWVVVKTNAEINQTTPLELRIALYKGEYVFREV